MADRKKKPEHDDAWWAAQRHAYIEKNDILLSDYPSWEWVSPYDFWRTIFPEGFLQPRGEEVPWHEQGGGHPNGIAIQITNRTKTVKTKTRPWAKKDVEAVNRRRRADAKAKREADECGRIEGAARAEQHRKDLLDCWGAHIDEETLQEGRRDHTAYQWCDLGFVPIAEARWRLTRYGGNSAWYYCSPWDVRYDPDRAKELLETGPREYDRLPDGRLYDGRPWWQA